MTCRRIDLGAGAYAIVCSRGERPNPCSVCGKPSTKLCDFELSGRKAGKTCDARLCDSCAVSAGEGIDHCPAHARLFERKRWRTVAQMAATWKRSEADVETAITMVGVRDSKAHADGEGPERRYSPQAQAHILVELKGSKP